MRESALENAIVVVLLGATWYIFVKFIYKPNSHKSWFMTWVYTSSAISAMYALTWLMSSGASNLIATGTHGKTKVVIFLILTFSLFIFAWLWQYVITSEKSILNSGFEIITSVAVADAAVLDSMSEIGGAWFRFLIFVICMILISKLTGIAQKRYFFHLSCESKQKWRFISAGIALTPFVASPLLLIAAENSTSPALLIPINILIDAPMLFEEYI